MYVKINIWFDLKDFEEFATNDLGKINTDRAILERYLLQRYNITKGQIDKKDFQRLLKEVKRLF